MLRLICWTADIRSLKHNKDVVCHGNGRGTEAETETDVERKRKQRRKRRHGNGCGNGRTGLEHSYGDPFARQAANYRELSDLEVMLEQICEGV